MSVEKLFDIVWLIDLIVNIILKTVVILAINFWLIMKWKEK